MRCRGRPVRKHQKIILLCFLSSLFLGEISWSRASGVVHLKRERFLQFESCSKKQSRPCVQYIFSYRHNIISVINYYSHSGTREVHNYCVSVTTAGDAHNNYVWFGLEKFSYNCASWNCLKYIHFHRIAFV